MNQFTFYANKPSQDYNKIDIWLLGSILLLWGLGIFTLYICSQNFAIRAFGNPLYFVKRQLLCSVVGFALFFGFLITDMKYIRKLVSVIVIVSFLLFQKYPFFFNKFVNLVYSLIVGNSKTSSWVL